MQFTVKLGEANVIFNYKGLNQSNPSMTFLVFQTDEISVDSFGGLPEKHNPDNEDYIRELHVNTCKLIAIEVKKALLLLGLSEENLSHWNSDVRVILTDEQTKIPMQFMIYFPVTIQRELVTILGKSSSQAAPIAPPPLLDPSQPPESVPALPPSQPPSLAGAYQPAAARNQLSVLPGQQPLPLQSQDLHDCIMWFEKLFTKHLGIEGHGNEKKYERNADYGINVTGSTIISDFSKQHLRNNYEIANKGRAFGNDTFSTVGKKQIKVPDFYKYDADLDMAVKEVWNSIMDKLLVVEELRLELVEQHKDLAQKRANLAVPDQNDEITKLTKKMTAKENEMRVKENEIIFILNAYRSMFEAIARADAGTTRESIYEAKFTAIESCRETLVKLGWKGRVFIAFCTLLGVIIGAACGFFLGATGGVIAGAMAGTALVPVPIFGTVKGAVVGGTVTGVWAAIKAGGIGGAIGSGVGAALMGLGAFGLSWYAANRTYSMDTANLHFFKACDKVVKHAKWLEEPIPDANPRAATLARMSGSSS